MITKETVEKIWSCYREIETCEELLKRLERKMTYDEGMLLPGDTLRNLKYCQLCVSLGETLDEVFDIHPKLARSVIQAHIAEKKQDLIEANEEARIDLYDVIGPGEISISKSVDPNTHTEGSGLGITL